jgi:hypothetical protein
VPLGLDLAIAGHPRRAPPCGVVPLRPHRPLLTVLVRRRCCGPRAPAALSERWWGALHRYSSCWGGCSRSSAVAAVAALAPRPSRRAPVGGGAPFLLASEYVLAVLGHRRRCGPRTPAVLGGRCSSSALGGCSWSSAAAATVVLAPQLLAVLGSAPRPPRLELTPLGPGASCHTLADGFGVWLGCATASLAAGSAHLDVQAAPPPVVPLPFPPLGGMVASEYAPDGHGGHALWILVL